MAVAPAPAGEGDADEPFVPCRPVRLRCVKLLDIAEFYGGAGYYMHH